MSKVKTMYRVLWEGLVDTPVVRDFRIISGPDEGGRYKARARYGAELVHQDWLRDSKEAAIAREEERERERHAKRMAALGKLRLGLEGR